MRYKSNKKGFALIWSLLLMTILLVVATTIATTIVKESRMSVNSSDSLRAYSAAQTGLELAKTQFVGAVNAHIQTRVASGGAEAGENETFTFSGSLDSGLATYEVVFWPGPKQLIESRGRVGNVNRKIDYVLASPSSVITNSDLSAVIAGNKQLIAGKSFSFSFDFWANSNTTQTVQLSNAAGYINVVLRPSTDTDNVAVTLNAHLNSPTTNKTLSESVPIGTDLTATPYAYNIKLDFVSGGYLRYTLTRRDITNLAPSCAKSNILDLTTAPGAMNLDLSGGMNITFTESVSLVSPGGAIAGEIFRNSSNSFWMANFKGGGVSVGTPQHTLTLEKTGTGNGTVTATGDVTASCDPSCPSTVVSVNSGAAVTLTATPAAGSSFTGWSSTPAGVCSGSGVCSFTLSTDVTITASFGPVAPITLNVGQGSFSVTGGVAPFSYTTNGTPASGSGLAAGVPVTVTAPVTREYDTTHWTYQYCTLNVTVTDSVGTIKSGSSGEFECGGY